MDGQKYKISRGLAFSLPQEDVDKLISQADGDLALLYLYILRSGGELGEDSAARDLRRTGAEIRAAAGKLAGLGLLSAGGEGRALRPAPELPEYSAEEISGGVRGDFKTVVEETQRVFGRMLSGTEIKCLFGIYDHLSLPAEVILLLINHCVEECAAVYGKGRLPSMRRVEKEAYVWSDNEALTFEAAESYLKRKKERSGAMSEIKRLLQIRGRDFSATEKKYVEGWLSMGFTPQALEIAYDKTVVKTGGMNWKYMNSIVASWHGKGLHTPGEITAGDSQPARRAPGPVDTAEPEPRPQTGGDLDRMRKILEIVKKS